jgi:hypothetical protein
LLKGGTKEKLRGQSPRLIPDRCSREATSEVHLRDVESQDGRQGKRKVSYDLPYEHKFMKCEHIPEARWCLE